MEQQVFLSRAERYQDMIYRIALNALTSPQDAEDVLQEVLLKLYKVCQPPQKEFEGEEHLRHWLIRVTVNACRDVHRSAWRRKTLPLETASASIPFEEPVQQELFEAVMALPERYRVVLYLFYYEDLTAAQIAAALKLSVSAVTTRLCRGREKLRHIWKED